MYKYRLEVSHKNCYSDEALNKVVGKEHSDFSGYGSGVRDLGWYFNHQKDIFKAFSKLRKYRKLLSITITYNADE